jgi:hypothetical protein
MPRLAPEKREEVISLRRLGLSIPEIRAKTGVPITTIQRNVKGVQIPSHLMRRLKEKQGGSKARAEGLRDNCFGEAVSTLATLSERDRLMLLLGIYWGEGTKKDLAIINSDPLLLQTFVYCITSVFPVSRDHLSAGVRVHKGISIADSKRYWSRTLGIAEESFHRAEIIEGKKKGKLPYGMCRVRIRSGIRTRLLIQMMISLVGKDSAEKVLSR